MSMTKDELVRFMERRKLDDEQLAILWGISPRTIEGWRYGRPIPQYVKLLIKSMDKHKRKK